MKQTLPSEGTRNFSQRGFKFVPTNVLNDNKFKKNNFFWHSHPSKPLQEISTAYQYIETINKKTLSYKYLKDVHTCFKQFMRNNLILAVGRKSPSPINSIAKYHWFTRLWILKSTQVVVAIKSKQVLMASLDWGNSYYDFYQTTTREKSI